MPETGMDVWVFVGVIATVVSAFAAWRFRSKKTTNIAINSSHVHQSGGDGTTVNRAKDSDNVRQDG
jgi:hypothetical protein